MDAFIQVISTMTMLDLLLIIITALLCGWLGRGFLNKMKQISVAKQRIAELEKQKCEGPHKWFNMPVMGKMTHVCEECGWTPDYQHYVKKNFIKAEKEALIFREKLENYYEEKLKDIAVKHNMSPEYLQGIVDNVNSIKKDFALDYLSEKLTEMAKENNV